VGTLVCSVHSFETNHFILQPIEIAFRSKDAFPRIRVQISTSSINVLSRHKVSELQKSQVTIHHFPGLSGIESKVLTKSCSAQKFGPSKGSCTPSIREGHL